MTVARLLVVDDDPVSRLILRSMLERLGHIVTEADGVDAALELLSTMAPTDRPELIICDYVMPERDGLDLLEARPLGDVPFVLLTGELNQADLHDHRVDDVTAYLTKPVASEELARVVTELVDPTQPGPSASFAIS